MALHFVIPGKPTAWQRVGATVINRRTGKPMRINPAGMKKKQEAIAWAAKAALHGSPPMAGPLRLEVLAVYAPPVSWPNWKRAAAMAGTVWKTSTPDHDNITKQVGDALNGIAFVDDAQIVRSSVAKRYGQPERTEVRITHVDGLSEDAPQEAFQQWLAINGDQAQIRAAGRWLANRRQQQAAPDLFHETRNTRLLNGPK